MKNTEKNDCYLYSNEIVFRGHPDKVADQISDALLDAYMAEDMSSRCAIETVGGKGKIFITGEVTSIAKVDVESVVRRVLKDICYRNDYEIINNLGVQSPDIAMGVDVGGAGDQGMMFGYACNDTPEMLPTAVVILQRLSKFYDVLVHRDDRFLADGKAQITGVYSAEGKLLWIKDFTISYQNTEVDRKETDAILINMVKWLCCEYGINRIDRFLINHTGKFLIGGFEGDAGLTGRKVVVDNYHSFANVGGGAFSGKDPTKVDRSAAYMARWMAKQYVRNMDLKWCELQVSYAIGLSKPLAIYIRSDKGPIEVDDEVYAYFCPKSIIRTLGLRYCDYQPTAAFGHFGNLDFPWEKL